MLGEGESVTGPAEGATCTGTKVTVRTTNFRNYRFVYIKRKDLCRYYQPAFNVLVGRPKMIEIVLILIVLLAFDLVMAPLRRGHDG